MPRKSKTKIKTVKRPSTYKIKVRKDSTTPEEPINPVYYIVRKGDILSRIAEAKGTPVKQLIAWNKGKYPSLIKDRDYVKPGWVLRVK